MNSTDWLQLADQSGGPDACWPSLAYVNRDGYAVLWCSDLKRGVGVARLALADKLGRPIAARMHALHTCDNRCCINPAHIYEGTPAENGRDMAARGRARNAFTKYTLGPVVYASAHGVVLAESNHGGIA